MDIFRMFNKYSDQNVNLIRKALTSASGVGEALIPENLEKLITDTVVRLSPEIAMVMTKKITGKVHEFNQLTERPSRGGAMGEEATTPTTNSKTTRSTVTLKLVRRKGKVTNFLQNTSEEYIDAMAYEMENHLQAHVLDIIYYLYWGNANANTYEFSGLEQFIQSNRKNEARGGAVPTTLKFLDDMIDSSNRKGGARHKRAFLMTPEMLSLVSRLLTNVRLNQGLQGQLSQVDIGGGWRMNAYRDVPIIETTSLGPVEKMDYTLISLTGVSTGGALSNGTYYLQIAPVTYEGEQEACTEVSITLSGGTSTQRIKIDLSAPHSDASGVENVLSYKIYASTTTATETLVKHVSAFVYGSDGTPTGDNGVDASIYVTTLTPSTDVPTHMQSDVPLVATSSVRPQSVLLWDIDPIQGLGKLPFTNAGGSAFEGLVTTEELARTDDFMQFLVKTYTALTPAFEKTSYWHRGLRIA